MREKDYSQLQFDQLIGVLRDSIKQFPEPRTGNNKHYSLEDISLASFSVFFTQSPSFLAFQTAMKESQRTSNCSTLFGMNEIPTDVHIRNILDSVDVTYLQPVFDSILERLNDSGLLDGFRSFGNDLLLVIDGTQYFSSKTIHCDSCLKKHHKNGKITYHHNLLTAALVTPESRKALVIAPEFISGNDGNKKQDCELTAAARWLERMGERLSPLGVTIAGDDMFCNQPFIQRLIDADLNYLFVCKPDSHKYLYEWLTIAEHENDMQEHVVTHWTGREHETTRYRFTNRVPLRDTEDALYANWAEVTVTDKDGKQKYHNTFVTNHILEADNIESFIKTARARWKIENETNNTLKTKGYHLEHNFGHGSHHLSETLASLNILAFLFHTILELVDERYSLIRKTLPRRDRFFQDIQALTTYFCFENWVHLLKTMLTGLKLEDPG